MKATNVTVGICKSCIHYHVDEDLHANDDFGSDAIDPNTGFKPGEFCDIYEQNRMLSDIDRPGSDIDHQCPLWTLIDLYWCPRHNLWSIDECDECMKGDNIGNQEEWDEIEDGEILSEENGI